MESTEDQEPSKQDGGGGGGNSGSTAVRRPMNAFLIFCKRHRSLVREKNQHLDNRSVTRILGELWASLPAEEKLTYTDLAKQYKDAFMKANPDYKWYNPEKSSNTSNTAPPSKSPPQPLSRHIVLSQGRKTMATGDAVTPGKLADPSNMGGLSLLLMAGTSLDNSEKTPPQPAAKGQNKGSSLLQLAEMCTTALEEPESPEQPATDRPRAVTMVTNNWSAMTPPYTPKHEGSPKQDNAFEGWTSVKSDQKLCEPSQEIKFKANQPSNQIQSSKSSAPMFRTKAALKSPPQFVGSQYSTEAFTEIKPPVVNKKLYSIVPVPAQRDSTNDVKADSKTPTKGGQSITMDNFIESMYCHEGKLVENAAQQKRIAAISSSIQPPMTFGQIQERLIRKAMESSYTNPSKNEAIPKVEFIGMQPKTEASILPQLIPSSVNAQLTVAPNGSLTVSAPQASQTVQQHLQFTGQANPQLPDDKKEVSLTPFLFPLIPSMPKTETECKEEKQEEEDLTCHEKMDDSSPVTREEIEKKLLSSAEKIQAALNSDLPVATPRIPQEDRSASIVRKLQHAAEKPPKKKRKTAKNQNSQTKDSTPVAKEEERKAKTPSPTESVTKTAGWKRHDSAKTEDNSDSDTDRLHISQDSEGVGEGEDSGGGLRKSHRRNRGKRYQQLVSQGLIHSSRHKQRTESQSEEAADKGDKDFTPSPGTLPSQGITRKRKRTISETSASEEGIKYKTGDFDLEEKIARLRPCLIDCPPSQSSATTAPGNSKKHKRLHPRPRHVSTSAVGSASSVHLAYRRYSHGAAGESKPRPQPGKSDVLNIAELRLLPKPDAPKSSAPGTMAAESAGEGPSVTGSAKRKVRKSAIRRIVPLPGSNVADLSNNNVNPVKSTPENSNNTTPADNNTNDSNAPKSPSSKLSSDNVTKDTTVDSDPSSNKAASPAYTESSSPSNEKENASLDVNSNSSHHTSLVTTTTSIATTALPIATSPATMASGPADHSNLTSFAHLAVESREKSIRDLGKPDSNAIRVSS